MIFLVIAIISISLLLVYALLMAFYTIGWNRTPYYNQLTSNPKTTVSIIVPARNEAENIVNCIQALIKQQYPKSLFEIIIVDDNSEDSTMSLAQSFDEPILKVVSLDPHETQSFKKRAIESGIGYSKNELIVTTDADCIMNDKWLLSLISYYEQYKPKMIAGPVAFRGDHSWLEKWQTLDLMGLMGITAGAISNGFPNMCNGANLAYERKAFVESGGFNDIDRLPTGDDIFLMLKLHALYPGEVKFIKSPHAVVYTTPLNNLRQLVLQRMRWVSKSTAYQDRRISLVLLLVYVFNLIIVINLFLGLLIYPALLTFFIILLLAKSLLELPLFISTGKFFGKQQLLIHFIPAQIAHILYVILIGLISKLFPYTWKGRTYMPHIQVK